MGFVLIAVICGVTALLAARKGYNPIIWFFAGGIIGLLVLAFLPNVKDGGFSGEELQQKLKTGNIAGGIIAAIAIAFMIVGLVS